MKAFYLKLNRPSVSLLYYVQHWIDTLQYLDDIEVFILCDKQEIDEAVKRGIRFGKIQPEFIKSDKTSEEARYIVEHIVVKNWENAAYAHLTTFLHAKANAYESFWNIDADDTCFCANADRVAKMLQTVERYAEGNDIKCFSLDMHRTNELGRHWSFGITYTNNSIDWIDILKSHCEDSDYINQYDNVMSARNFDWFMTYMSTLNEVRIETFYFENLRFIHHTDDVYRQPRYGLSYWKNGRRYLPMLCHEFGLGEAGSLPIPEDVIKFDIALTEGEASEYLIKNSIDKWCIDKYINVNSSKIERNVSILITLHDSSEYIGNCLNSLVAQTLQDVEVLIVDEGSSDSGVAVAKGLAKLFNNRMKIFSGAGAYDKAVNVAVGEYILFMDSDDLLLPNALSILFETAKNFELDCMHTLRFLSPSGDGTQFRQGMPLFLGGGIWHNF